MCFLFHIRVKLRFISLCQRSSSLCAATSSAVSTHYFTNRFLFKPVLIFFETLLRFKVHTLWKSVGLDKNNGPIHTLQMWKRNNALPNVRIREVSLHEKRTWISAIKYDPIDAWKSRSAFDIKTIHPVVPVTTSYCFTIKKISQRGPSTLRILHTFINPYTFFLQILTLSRVVEHPVVFVSEK